MRLFLRRWPWILIVLLWSQCLDSWMYRVEFPFMLIYECVKHSSEHLILTITTLFHMISVYDYSVVHVSIVWILFTLAYTALCCRMIHLWDSLFRFALNCIHSFSLIAHIIISVTWNVHTVLFSHNSSSSSSFFFVVG